MSLCLRVRWKNGPTHHGRSQLAIATVSRFDEGHGLGSAIADGDREGRVIPNMNRLGWSGNTENKVLRD
jgi:hypothetical protein